MIDGVNSQLNDLDFYDTVRKVVKRIWGSYDLTLPYFRKNPFLSRLTNTIEPLTSSYLSGLKLLLQEIDMKMNPKGEISHMLDSMKNSLIGRVHYPHPHFMEKGAFTISL